jgi:glucosamine kinase
MTFYLGVDAGGTACKSRLVNKDGIVLGTGTAGPANTRIGISALHVQLLDVCRQATAAAGLSEADERQIKCGMGIAGINRTGMKQQVQLLSFPFADVQISSDAMIANLGAHSGGDGAVLILGTGSIGFAKQGDETFSIGGYGFPISDEGSGAALGLSAVRHALRALDGRTKPTPLSHAITLQFDHAIPNVITWMDGAVPRDYARFAPLVLDYADNNDRIAVSIVRAAAVHVECLIETIMARGAVRCVLMGGLAKRMKPWLRMRVASLLQEPEGDALDGAIILAGKPIGSAASLP